MTMRVIISPTLLLTLTQTFVHVVEQRPVKFTSQQRWNQKFSLHGKLLCLMKPVIAQLNYQMVLMIQTLNSYCHWITQHSIIIDKEDISHAEDQRVIWKEKKLNSQEM